MWRKIQVTDPEVSKPSSYHWHTRGLNQDRGSLSQTRWTAWLSGWFFFLTASFGVIFVVLSLSLAQLFATPGTAAYQASPSSPSPRVYSDSCPLSPWWPSSHLILGRPLLLLPSIFPSIRVFSNESALCIRWTNYSVSQSVLQWIFRVDFLCNWLVWSPCSPSDPWESSPASQFEIINLRHFLSTRH